MMNGDNRLFLKLLRFYVNGEFNKTRTQTIEKLFLKNECYQVYFDLIAHCKKMVPDHSVSKQNININITNPAKIDDLILKITSGDFSQQEAQYFLNLVGQPYNTVHRKLIDLISTANKSYYDSNCLHPKIHVFPDTSIFERCIQPTSFNKNRMQHTRSRLSWFASIGIIMQSLVLPRKRKYVLAPAFGFAIAILFLLIFKSSNPYRYFIYSNKIPYEFEASQLRSHIDQQHDNIHIYFETTLNNGASDYVTGNYAGAISNWESVLPIANRMYNGDRNDMVPVLNDYYFYLGITYLASGKEFKSIKKKNNAYQKAILYLNKALVLSNCADFNDSERNRYYLGLSYVFTKQYQNAIHQFERISSESKFFQDSSKLLKKYQNLLD